MLKILPPIWFFIFLIIALSLHFWVPVSHVFEISNTWTKILGIVLFVAGMLVSMKASKQFAENKTEILPTSPTNSVLVTDGMYKITRNPMYLGMVTALLGIAFYVGTLPVFLAPLAQFLVLNFVFIPFEEQKLERIFGQAYSTYKATVRRWV